MNLTELIAHLQELADMGDAEVLVQESGQYNNSEPMVRDLLQINHRLLLGPPVPSVDAGGLPTRQQARQVIIVFDRAIR